MNGSHVQGLFVSQRECVTFHRVASNGIQGIISPAGDEEESARIRVPFYLRGMYVSGLYFWQDEGSLLAAGASATQTSSASDAGPSKKRKRRRQQQQQQAEGPSHPALFHACKQPSFENICGSVYLAGMWPLELPPEFSLSPIFSHPDAASTAVTSVGGGGGRRKKKGCWFMGLHGREIFTVHGNLVLRKYGSGTSINFKVTIIINTAAQSLTYPCTLNLKISVLQGIKDAAMLNLHLTITSICPRFH